ncbi:hypothetical protein SteCoe_36559 [Stentor coeruleus]|uniref:Major facilitator superfamily (MFS) profile domain-containing protein n=1 Tax=Stentor coeruleus TaxID=5963 RepID=A0A1R2APV8_9CILI|nr:hypothetical protein SteCoe_36559 [Stentor coeruleus]
MGIDVTFIGLFIANTIACAVYSILAPYLPTEANARGINSFIVGLMLAGYPLTAFISSLLLGKYLGKFGKRRVLVFGCSCEMFSTLGYSLLPFLPIEYFLILGFTLRLFQGLGAGCIGTSTYSLIVANYPNEIQKYLGILNISSALGFMAGPVGASMLFAIGGFSLIYITFGLLNLLLIPMVYCLIDKDIYSLMGEHDITSLDLIKNSIIRDYFFVLIISSISMCFISPTYSLHLQSFNISDNLFGLIFALPTVSFIASIYFVINNSWGHKRLFLSGIIILIIANLTIGPWEYLYLPHSIYISLIGIFILGIGICFIYLSALPEAISKSHYEFSNYPKDYISDLVSGLANSFSFMAEMVAPPCSGYLRDHFGFENAQALLAGATFVCLLYLINSPRLVDSLKTKIESTEMAEITETLKS